MINIIGVDPGITGAIALLNDKYKLLELEDIPTLVERVVNGKAKRCINYKKLQLILIAWLAEHGELVAYVEDVHSMPAQSVQSMFNMGHTFGAIKAVLSCENITINYVSPLRWKKHLNLELGSHLKSNEKKEISRQCAIKTYPNHANLFSRKADHNRAEAVLIAKYGVAQLNTDEVLT